MAMQGKTRRTPRRRTTVVTGRLRKPAKAGHHTRRGKSGGFIEAKHAHHHHGVSNYTKAMRFLGTLADFEKLRIVRYNSQNFDLDRMRTLLKKMGNPQDQFRTVHVAGTKGKGSTCAMIASMLQANGYRTGLYTSPHLVDIRERISID